MNLPFTLPKGMDELQAWSQAIAGRLSLYSQGPSRDSVQKVASAIRKTGGQEPVVTVLPVTFSNGDCGPVQLPLFQVETAGG